MFFRKSNYLYPGRDLNPGPSGLEHSANQQNRKVLGSNPGQGIVGFSETATQPGKTGPAEYGLKVRQKIGGK